MMKVILVLTTRLHELSRAYGLQNTTRKCVTFQELGSIVSNFLECPVSEALFEFHANIPGATKVSRKKVMQKGTILTCTKDGSIRVLSVINCFLRERW